MNRTNNNARERVLQRIEEETKRRFLPIIGKAKGKLLESIVKKKQPRLILEVGTLVGYSAILMARNLNRGKIITIEISPRNARSTVKNIEEAGLADKIIVVQGDALKVIKRLKERFELVFIDAAKEEYLTYLQLLEKNGNIGKGTIVVADNVKIFADAMRDYLEYVRDKKRYKSSYYDFGFDGMEVSVKI